MRKHLRRINKSLKQNKSSKFTFALTLVAIIRKLGIKLKNFTADNLYSLVRDKKVSYEQIREIDPKRFKDLESTMKMIFNHDDEMQELP